MEAMKKKYQLVKKKRGYTISSIKDKAIHVATQILVEKVMHKFRADEVATLVIVLTK